jgi:hypothetical protein
MTQETDKMHDLITDLMYLRKESGFTDNRVYEASTFMSVIGGKNQIFESIKIRFTSAIRSLPDKQNVEALLVAYGLLPGYKQAVHFKGDKPAIVWSYYKLSRIERPGEPTDKNHHEVTEDGIAEKEFTQLYNGLFAGIAWRWK